jgi:hypothetical protein
MTTLGSLCLNCMSQLNASNACSVCGGRSYPQITPIALPAKTVLNGRFCIGRVLGKPGGFGITYLAWDSILETTAAIKEYLPLQSVSRDNGDFSVPPNSEQNREFFQEAKTLAQFSHPNIVRIRDYFTANNTAYLVMDYHSGFTNATSQPTTAAEFEAGNRPQPPQSAFFACSGKPQNAACRFYAPSGMENGRCLPLENGQLVCVPLHEPPPPPKPGSNRQDLPPKPANFRYVR